jgi:predicted O-methyltransferase YrrM
MAEPEVRVFDKLLPNLRTNNEYFAGSDEEYVPALYETIARASGLLEPGEELVFESSERFTQAAMGSNPVSTRFLQILARLVRAERVLEVGTFVGVSAIYLARALEAGGRVVTIEKFPEFAAIAQRNFVANGVQDRITLLVGDAIERIEELPADEPFDLVFLDGHKERYAEYFEAIAPLAHRRPARRGRRALPRRCAEPRLPHREGRGRAPLSGSCGHREGLPATHAPARQRHHAHAQAVAGLSGTQAEPRRGIVALVGGARCPSTW